MNLKMKYILFYLLAIIFSIFIFSCSELNTDIPPAPKVNIHGDSVYSATSPNYHPKTIAGSPNGMYDCQECHAADFSGGVAKVGCNTRYCHPTINVHITGVIDPSSDNFHGKYIRNDQWDMSGCQSCHAEDYSGGFVSPSCKDCHTYPGGPENCTTCHGSPTSNAPPTDINGNTSTTERGVGAHQIHLKGGEVGRNLTCTECHNVPGGVYTPGHVDSELPAEVLMSNPRANTITNDPSTSQYDPNIGDPNNEGRFTPDPTYNSTDLTCSNTYCHGYFKNGNLDNKPVWTNPATSACGSCHGNATSPLPKTVAEGGSHLDPSGTNCSVCHGGVVDANLNIINPSKHIDGKLNLYGDDIVY